MPDSLPEQLVGRPEIASFFQIPDGQMLVCGMSLGHVDDTAIENRLVTQREPVSSFTTFHPDTKETMA